MVPQQPVDRPASESGSALAAHVPPPTSPPLEEGRRVSSQPATTPVPEPELTVEVGDRPATGLMEETVIYSVDDYYTRCASGCGRVSDLQLGGCRFESRPGVLRTKVYTASHPYGVGK